MPGCSKPGTIEGMNTTLMWILIAVAVIVLLAIVLVVVGKKRGDAKKVSFEKPAEEAPKELTQEQKSGNYQAKSGFNFAPAGSGAKEPEKVPAQPSEPTKPAEPAKPVEPTKPAEPAKPAEPETEKSAPAAGAATGAAAAGTAAAGAAAAAASKPAESEPAKTEPEKAKPVADETPVEQPAVEEPAAEEPVAEAPQEEAIAEEPTVVTESTDEVPTDEAAESPAEMSDAEAAEAEEAAAAADAQTQGAEAALEAEPEELEVSADAEVVEAAEATEPDIAPAGGRLGRLRGRLSRSQNAIGQGLMGILSAGDLDEEAWEEIEDTLIMADLGTKSTMKVTEALRDKFAERGVASEEEARAMLRECLIEAGHPEMDRSIKAMPNEGKPAVIMVVGVNGTGKTTTTGKLARVLVAMGHKVLLGAADTFRAAAADQLETWGRRVGASTVRGKEGADPASVAFDAVAAGVDQGVDVVLVDTAGRLHTSVDLMDQLGKVKRVVEKKTEVDEVLLVLDATVGQNGLAQARIFREVVDITGVVLTKLDGTAKGGIVFQVQEELGVPVKLVGLGEGADDLAPFEVEGFVDALLGEK